MKRTRTAGDTKRLSLMLPVLAFFLLSACATPPAIRVNYQLPDPAPDRPPVSALRLTVVDKRQDPSALTPVAQKKLKHFSGTYALVMAPKGEEAPIAGIYDLSALFRTVFEKRLARMGIRTVEDAVPEVPELKVVLTLFQLDLRNYKWHFRMGYDVQLIQDGRVLVKQSLNGQTERVDIPGVDDSGTAVSEIFPDLINQLDIAALLKKGGV